MDRPWVHKELDMTEQLTLSTLSLRADHSGVIISQSEQTLVLCKQWLLIIVVMCLCVCISFYFFYYVNILFIFSIYFY